MTITPGQRLGNYEVLSLIGKGGMGEVYRARDTQLQRDVALKLLPDVFASDPERLARFQREAQVLAALNHPNIAQIYGLEGAGASRCIVMELARNCETDCRSAGSRARERHHPPRSKTRQRQDHTRWESQSPRFRTGQAATRSCEP